MKSNSSKKLRIAITILVGILLLAAVLLWLSPLRRVKIVTSSLEIPEGWEIVSQKDGVTHIRMKEGADAYYWIVDNNHQNQFFMDVSFPGNPSKNSMKPDDNGEFHVAAYVGYNQFKPDESLDPANTEPYRLIYSQRGVKVELYEFDLKTMAAQKNVVYDGARVGLTEAFIYSMPESQFADASGTIRLGVRQIVRKSTADGESSFPKYSVSTDVDYTTLDGMIHFDSEYAKAVNGDPDHPFLSLLGGLLAPIIGVLHIGLFAFAIAWTVLCTKNRQNPFLVTLPCLAGAVCSWLVMVYYDSLPAHGMFGGFEHLGGVLFAFFGIWAYTGLAVIFLIVRLVVVRIQVCREKKCVQENSQSEE